MLNNDYDEFLKELDIFLNMEDKNVKNEQNKVFESKVNENLKENLSKKNKDNVDKDLLSIKNVEYKDIKTDLNLSIKDLNVDDKPREKLYKFGADKLFDYELVAILLGSGSKDEDVLSISKKLWKYILKFQRISELTVNDLLKIKGIGLSKASSIIAALELSKRINIKESVKNFTVDSPKSVADIFMNILRDELKEHFYVILLDTKNNIISWDEISRGDLNSSIVHPREVFKYALKYSANSLICLHNHPSGDPTPSKEDINITKRLYEVADLVGIKLLDHIIIGYNKHISLKAYGAI